MPETFYALIQTKTGWVGLLASSRGLKRTTLPQDAELKARIALGQEAASGEEDWQRFRSLAEQYHDYFAGRGAIFDFPLDLSEGTAFQQQVWRVVREIPHGQTRTYGEVAAAIGKPGAARAVGQAMGSNPVPIVVPCHRVVRSSGGPGGFGGGLSMKLYLLDLEKGAPT